MLENVHVRRMIHYITFFNVFIDLEPYQNVKFIRNFRRESNHENNINDRKLLCPGKERCVHITFIEMTTVCLNSCYLSMSSFLFTAKVLKEGHSTYTMRRIYDSAREEFQQLEKLRDVSI